MKALALEIWEMPSGEFALWTIAFFGVIVVVRFIAAELDLSRVKRMARFR